MRFSAQRPAAPWAITQRRRSRQIGRTRTIRTTRTSSLIDASRRQHAPGPPPPKPGGACARRRIGRIIGRRSKGYTSAARPPIRAGVSAAAMLIPGIPFAPHGCSVRAAGLWARVAGVVVEIGKLDELAGKYPKFAADLRAIAASVQHVG